MSEKITAYVGTYTRGESKGLYILDVDPDTGIMNIRDTVELHNPTFIETSYDGKYLYSSCDEGIASFSINEDGSLKFIGQTSVGGLRPGYIAVDRANQFLICGGYHDGKITSILINDDGSAGDITDEIFLKGLGNVGSVHYRSHVSCTIFSPDEKYVIAVDLGSDQSRIYSYDHYFGTFTLHDILRSELESGPRIMQFSADGRFAFLNHEYSNEVSMYAYDAETAQFTELTRLSSIPEGYEKRNSSTMLRLSPDDKHLFVTNSGDNSVAVFEIDKNGNSMRNLCILPVSGEYPRDIVIMPDSIHFASVNHESSTITTFKMNYEKDYFLMKNRPLEIPAPTCLKLLQPRNP